MMILVVDETAKVFSLECESTDTIVHLETKLDKITSHLMFDGKLLGEKFSESMTLADVGVQDGSMILDRSIITYPSRLKPEKDYLYYADAFKSGWREEHTKALLHLLLELCQDGTISEGNVTDEAWLRIQNNLKNSIKCSFEIEFLKERLHDYKQLYLVLAETTSSSIFKWDRERKTITITGDDWRTKYPELLLLCGPYLQYFDTLEEVCLLLNTRRSWSREFQNLQPISSMHGKLVMNERNLRSTMKIFVMDLAAEVFSLECESTDTIAHLKAKLDYITGDLMFDGKLLGDDFSENMTLADVGIQDGSLTLICRDPRIRINCFSAERETTRQRVPKKDYLYYADAFKSGWREEHAKALLHLLLELCQDGTISEGNVTDEAWLAIQNSLKNSMQCSFEIDFLRECLRDYKELYAILIEETRVFNWDRERKTVTIQQSEWRQNYPELLLLCGPYIPYFDTLEEVCLLLNTGQSSEQRVSKSSTNKSTMHGKQVRQNIPLLSKLRRLFGKSQRS